MRSPTPNEKTGRAVDIGRAPEARGWSSRASGRTCGGRCAASTWPSAAPGGPGGAAAAQLPHQEAEIEGARVDQQPFEDVAMSAQVGAPHPAGVVDMRERPFHVLPAAAQQPLAALPAHAPAIAVDGGLGVRDLPPLAAAALGL